MIGEPEAHQLLIEPIVAWRTWSVKDVDGQHLFTSPQLRSEWHAGQLVWDGVCRCESSRRGAARSLLASQRSLEILQREGISERHRQMDRMMVAFHIHNGGSAATAPAPLTAQDHIEKIQLRIKQLGQRDECHCGINAFATREQMLTSAHMLQTANHAVGEVELSGTVRKYEMGWRAEKGRVVRVWSGTHSEVDPELVRQAAKAADVHYMGEVDIFRPQRSIIQTSGASHAW